MGYGLNKQAFDDGTFNEPHEVVTALQRPKDGRDPGAPASAHISALAKRGEAIQRAAEAKAQKPKVPYRDGVIAKG